MQQYFNWFEEQVSLTMFVCLWQTAKGIYSKLNNTCVLLLGVHIVAMVTHDHNITLYACIIDCIYAVLLITNQYGLCLVTSRPFYINYCLCTCLHTDNTQWWGDDTSSNVLCKCIVWRPSEDVTNLSQHLLWIFAYWCSNVLCLKISLLY